MLALHAPLSVLAARYSHRAYSVFYGVGSQIPDPRVHVGWMDTAKSMNQPRALLCVLWASGRWAFAGDGRARRSRVQVLMSR
mmetsp:Transcript_11749/g.29706  ORF Transcript_11749/g.29706 Transcript_11749/m.29706 type:complete len:82 (+) Transcript_11749:287-532(+)